MTPIRWWLVAAWAALAGASAAVTVPLVKLGVPAAVLIGPMLTAIVFGLRGFAARVPRPLFTTAQGFIGCLIAAAVTPDILAEVMRDWPAMLLGLATTLAATTVIGIGLARFGTLPGSTAAWGSSAGAASAMVLLAQENGADPRLVATMQYVRVICVVISASVISGFLIEAPVSAVPAQPAATSAADLIGFAATVPTAVIGSWLGRRLGVPAGGLLVPLVIGAALNATGVVHMVVPPWLLATAYAAVGWAIGLQFERGSIVRSIRALPEMIGAALAVVALCGLAAWAMTAWLGIDPLTAFLGSSPGGIDTVAIIALSGGADTGFVMALQTLRLLVVIVTGPALARFVARWAARPD